LTARAYSDAELRYARPLANALLEDEVFRNWVLFGTRLGNSVTSVTPIGAVQGKLRSPNLKNPFWFNYWCGKDSRCECRIGTGIETDILLIFDCVNGRRLGLHIETKRHGDHLHEGQAESYPRRAACWADEARRPKMVPPHDDYLTMIACGRELASDLRLKHFDKVLYHDDVALKLSPYPEIEAG
jgi:hypothetical protein